MIEADTQAIYAAGWFFDVVNICGLYNLLNRVVHGCGIEVDQKKTTATAAELIPCWITVAGRICWKKAMNQYRTLRLINDAS